MSKPLSKLFLLLLSWFGLSSCVTTPKAEYGAPYATFLLDGMVVDAETSQPIEGIEIRFQHHVTYSDAGSNWAFSVDGATSESYFIIATDIDGEDNGGFFDPDTLWIDPAKTGFGSGWYTGTFEQHDILIELDESET